MANLVKRLLDNSLSGLKYALDRKPRNQKEHDRLSQEYHTMFGLGKSLLRFTPKYGFNPDGSGPVTDRQYREKNRKRQLNSQTKIKKQVMPRDGRKASLLGRSSLIERKSFT